MLDKILLVLLISLIHSDSLDVSYLKKNSNIDISNQKDAVICVQLYEDLKRDDDFYLIFSSDDKDKKMDKTIYYQPLDDSCENQKTMVVDFANLAKDFKFSEDKTNLETEEDGFSYEYKLQKKTDSQKYMLLLYRDFTGNTINIQYNPFAATTSLEVHILKKNSNIDISNQKDAVICVELYEDLKRDDNFYLIFSSKEKGKKMDKTIYYQPLDDSCENQKTMVVDFANLTKDFKFSEDKTNLETEEDGFSYEYKLQKKTDSQKYMLLLYRDFTGNTINIQYNPFAATTILIIVVVIIVSVIFVIIMIIVIICLCVRKRKQKQTLPQYQSSYVQEPIMPE